MEQFIETL